MTVVLASPPENSSAPLVASIPLDVGGLLIEAAKSFHHLVETDRGPAGSRMTQRRRGIDRTGVRCPRGQNGSLFVERQIRVVNDLGWVRECLSWMEEFVEIEIK